MATTVGDASYPRDERTLFARKATGLVRGWSVRDGFIYAFFSINLITLGLFIFVINALLFQMVGALVEGFHVGSFWSAFFGSIVYSVISWALATLLLSGKDG